MTIPTTAIPTEPGIYADVPFEQYLAWPYASQSGLKPGFGRGGSARKMHYRENNPKAPTPAMELRPACNMASRHPDRPAVALVVYANGSLNETTGAYQAY